MRILLDECLPRRLSRDLSTAHRVTTVPRQGWSGYSDQKLMQCIPEEVEVFVTMDANLPYQQNVETLGFLIVVLHAPSNRYESLKPFVLELLEVLEGEASAGVMTLGTGGG